MKIDGVEYWIGTSGWSYDDWKKRFYPEEIKKTQWLDYYARHYDTVEVNNSFYHLPKETTFEHWKDTVDADFRFTVKASRYITHIKKLKDAKEPVETFFSHAGHLGRKLGCVLYQLPPNLHKDVERLDEFLSLLPGRVRRVVEFRHQSWYDDAVYEILDKHRCGICVHDLKGSEGPRMVIGGLIYIRFHGTSGRYAGNYSAQQLGGWAGWICGNLKGVKAVYAYFNNDVKGHAVKNSLKLKDILTENT